MNEFRIPKLVQVQEDIGHFLGMTILRLVLLHAGRLYTLYSSLGLPALKGATLR